LGQFHLEKNYLLTTYYAVLEAGEFVRGDQSAIYREVISRALEKSARPPWPAPDSPVATRLSTTC
jgi:hypothetical protein